MSNSGLNTVRSGFMDVILQYAYPLVLETVLYTLHIVLTVYFLCHRYKDRRCERTPPARSMLFVTLAMFALISTCWAIDVYDLRAFITDEVNDLHRKHYIKRVYRPKFGSNGLWLSKQVIGCAILILGDCVLLWRAYVIYGRPRWLRILSIALVIVIIGTYVALVVLSLHPFARIFNALPNLFCTTLIAYKVRLHWNDVQKFAHCSGTSYGLAILTVVVESGCVFAAFSISYAILYGISFEVATWSTYYLTPLFAMYPILVVVLVTTHRSILERSIDPGSSLSSLHWAAPSGSEPDSEDNSHGTSREGIPRLEV
ncbi:hypothetical protein PENSPDRAFT_16582 [Peniophora sp. CONT]|nr:hypothetical protein PENSPDRAFT_16582 [Peniophora sp. CONT]